MTDYRALFDREYIAAFDLEGRDVIVTIERVIGGELISQGGRKDKKPIIQFVGKEKTFVCNKTNGKTIATLYGNKVEEWKGKRITLYQAMTRAPDGSGDIECIRVRPKIPVAKASSPIAPAPELESAPPPPEPEREPGSDG